MSHYTSHINVLRVRLIRPFDSSPETLFVKSWSNFMLLQQQIWNPTGSDERDDKNGQHDDEANDSEKEQTIGFNVKNAVLFPPEVGKGRWPEDYSLSDHATLTVVLSPIRMLCHTPK